MVYYKHKLVIGKPTKDTFVVIETGNPDKTSDTTLTKPYETLEAARRRARVLSRELGIPFTVNKPTRKKLSEHAKQVARECLS